jgi:CRP-like cAMP-binding protein
MKHAYKKIILEQKLFGGCQPHMIEDIILSRGELLCFRSGEVMETKDRAVGILISGRGVIYSSDKGRQTLLRFIAPGDAVGVAGLFADKAPDTRIYACGDGKSEMFFIPKISFDQLLEYDPAFRSNLISFLADRIVFLNSKIDYVTAGSSERKLAFFIKSSPQNESGTVNLGMSMTSLALTLDLSRASLYRAFERLTEDGFLQKNGREFILHDPEAMLNAYQ